MRISSVRMPILTEIRQWVCLLYTSSGEDHQVIVKQLLEQGRVRIEIIDHGPGIEKDKLAYIWERYYKVDKTHVRSRVGSGLGLSIVKAVLELSLIHI